MKRFVAHTQEVAPCDPLAFFAGSRGERFYFERPAQGLALAAQGCLAERIAEGTDRFEALDAAARTLLAQVLPDGVAAPPVGPRLVGGFAFDHALRAGGVWRGFPAARFVLPERLLVRRDERCFVTVCAPLREGEDPGRVRAFLERPAELPLAPERLGRPASDAPAAFRARADRSARDYLGRVQRALDAIARGDLEKVVLARAVEVEGSGPFDAPALLLALRASYPDCASFAVAVGDAVFLGATPERLLAISSGRLETAALAGTAPRGRSPEEDRRLARALFESKKEQAEHAVVVRALRDALEPHCRSLHVPESPQLRRLEGIQHLETPLRGELARPVGLLALAGALHPTPAVGGTPRNAALAWLARHEALDRGWYGGGVGHVGPEDGELAVALRSALLRGGRAWCAAGAGIVAGSDPGAELDETRLKLRALLSPLLEL